MKFGIKFYADAVTIDSDDSPSSIAVLDLARAITGVKDLSPSLVDLPRPYGMEKQVYIELTEEQARSSGIFDKYIYENAMFINAPKYWLKDFVHLVPVINKYKGTGEIMRVYWNWNLDKESVVKEWLNVGAPISWSMYTGFEQPKKSYTEMELLKFAISNSETNVIY